MKNVYFVIKCIQIRQFYFTKKGFGASLYTIKLSTDQGLHTEMS